MRQRSALTAFLVGSVKFAAASSLLGLSACLDFTTGQDPEPPGPLVVTRLTLSDPGGNNSAGAPVFTDTSSPLDCALEALKDTAECLNTPFKDIFSPKNARPTADSATKLRVVFNKLPLKLNGLDVEKVPADGLPKESELVLSDPNVISLECDGAGCGVPESYNSLQVNGSDLSPDPTTFDYGPALQMQVLTSYDPMDGAPVPPTLPIGIPADPLRALEPGTIYRVVLNPGLSGRNPADKVLLDATAKSLLTFATEQFQVIRFGIGDFGDPDGMRPESDTRLGSACRQGSGTNGDPFIAAASADTDGMGTCVYSNLANDGVLTLHVNAGIDPSTFQPATVFATVAVDGGAATSVPVKVSLSHQSGEPASCDAGNQRTLYIAPASGTWEPTLAAGQIAVVKVNVRGADIRDVSQLAGHPAGMGRHVLSGDVNLQAEVTTTNTLGNGVISAASVNACP